MSSTKIKVTMKLKKLLLSAIGFASMVSYSQFNYGEALQKSIFFYEAQQSGELPDWNRVTWRGDSALGDGSDVGKDLTGGWYDAGDHVKFGFPMAYSVTALAWGAIEYPEAYESAGQMDILKRNLRYVTDYFIKCHTGPNELYGQLGGGGIDHAFWGASEVMTMARPAYKIDAANPGTELAAETASAMAAVSMLFADSDPAYSATLLEHAKQLYSFADNFRGKYSDAITDAAGFYNSWSGYQDELVWGAIWLYRATGDSSYLAKAESEYPNLGTEIGSDVKAYKWGLAWDDKSYGCYILMSMLTNNDVYKADAERHLDYWTDGYNGERIAYSPGGQAHLTTWGSLRHSSNTSLLAFIYSDKVQTSKANTYHDFAVRQINYALGDNPINRSFMVGFGNNPANSVHHRGAHGPWANSLQSKPDASSHILYGALAGGPSAANDQFEDDRGDFIANEVATDYNAAFTGALARMYSEYGGNPLSNFPQQETPTRSELRSYSKFNSNNAFGSTVSIMFQNRSAWPARVTDNVTMKYFFDISETVAAGGSIDDISISLSYSQTGSSSISIKEWDAASNIYYADISLVGNQIAPVGDPAFRYEVQLQINTNSNPYNTENDWSAAGLTGTATESPNIPVYDNGVLVFGNEPDGGDTDTPTADIDFELSNEEGFAPLTVDFDGSGSSDPNGDALTYSWDFGNGETSSLVSPTITFDEVGSYNVSLTVSDGVNTSAPVNVTIEAKDDNVAPVAVLSAEPSSGIAPITVDFDASDSSDANGDDLTYAWDFGDGTTGTGITTSHEYAEVGQYNVTLTVSDGSLEGTDTTTISVTDGSPIATISASETSGVAPFEVTFDGSDSVDPTEEGLTYAWDFGNGDTATTATASVTYSAVGTYTVTLTVTNTAGDSDSETTTISVTDGSQSCAFDTPTAGALPTINNAYNNIYVLGNGGPNLDNVTTFNINWNLENNGLYQLSMNTNNGQPSWYNDIRTGATVSFNSAQPEITFSGSDFAGLDGSYYATIDSNNFVLVSKTGGYTIYFSKSNEAPDCGDVQEPNTAPVAALTGTPNSGTEPLSVTFDASGSTDADGDSLSYSIDYGDGTSGTGVTSTHIYSEGEYTATVTVNDGNGGIDTASVSISVDEEIIIIDNTPPVAALTATPNSGTEPLSVTFDASDSTDADGDDLTYSIEYGDGTSGTGATSIHVYDEGEYTATVTVNDGNGGTDTASVNISVDEEIIVTPPGGDCTFGAPLNTSLASINTYFENVHVLGTGGPNMDVVNKFTVNWDLQNNGLYQFSFNMNASPWYSNFSNNNQNFNSPSPAITLTGTGISGLDGTYYASIDEGNFVLVADTYSIYFSNSATAPDCGDEVDPNEAPIADASADVTTGDAPLAVTFDGSGSTDPDGDTLTYAWSFSDGTSANGVSTSKTFTQAGDYTATLTVTDPDGLNDSDSVTISVSDVDVNEAPTAAITASSTSGEAPVDVSFNGSGSTDPDGDTLTYAWSFSDGTSASGVATDKTFDVVGTYTATLTVTDPDGLSDTAEVTITVTNGDPGGPGGGSDNEYVDRFTEMRNEIIDPENGYFSADGSPHHSIETLIVEAPDYGHESTSELYSYWMWMEAMHGRITGDWQPLSDVWETTERFIIPTNDDQPTNAAYSPSSPAAYAPEFPLPSGYPAPLNFTAPVGVDPVSGDLTATYGPDVYQMHWLLDNDNFYGYGNRGDGVSTPSYINTFQRGEQESVYETVPHPSWESFSSGGESGFLPLFTLDANYSEQWRYTSATDADARAVQAMYWALEWTKEQESSSAADLDLDKASKMGDYLRLGMFDKYFKPMGVQSATSGAGSGYDSAHYLMSWYISWGGAADTSSPWAFRISSSHCHFGYQNPVAAYALTQVDEMIPVSQNGERDWGVSLQRQMEFYTWLQSTEGGIAGGATNSWNGDYSPYPSGVSTFYDMAYDTNPVYHDPGSGTWFGWQAWSMERVAEYYYISNDPMAKNLMDKWSTWVESEVQLVGDDDFLMPATLEWSGQPDTWDPANPGSNSGLSVTVTNYNVDLGIAASTAKALIYYAAATEKYSTLDTGAKDLAQEILDRMWTTYRDDKGCSSPESRGDYARIFEEEVYVPAGFTGVMGRGETIEQGVTFLDLRSGYLTDPEYPALLEAYENGTDYTTNYHRTWAQMEIALANAEYGFFFGEDTTAAKSVTPDDFSVKTFPNPATDFITVSVTALDGSVTGKEIVVTNLVGQVVATKAITEGETSTIIDVSNYPSGMYIVTVYQGNDKLKVDKIVVN